jgi:hypothetical protein
MKIKKYKSDTKTIALNIVAGIIASTIMYLCKFVFPILSLKLEIPIWIFIIIAIAVIIFIVLPKAKSRNKKLYYENSSPKSLAPPLIYIEVLNKLEDNKLNTFQNELKNKLPVYHFSRENNILIAFLEKSKQVDDIDKIIKNIEITNTYIHFEYTIILANGTIYKLGNFNREAVKTIDEATFIVKFMNIAGSELSEGERKKQLSRAYRIIRRMS